MTEKAYAKLNISLDVVRKMDDGYHAMRMVMQSVSLCDDVNVELTTGSSVTVHTNLDYLPSDERNIAAKAARLFFDSAGMSGTGAEIVIEKRIPVCAGLGGGSSDGAAVLRALNKLTGLNLTPDRLMELGKALGSDVPFCVAGGTMLAEGRGDVLTRLTPLPHCGIVICKPEFSISTPKLFAALDCGKIKRRPDIGSIISALNAGDVGAVARRMYNVFEDVLPQRFSEIGIIKAKLLDYGALGVTMSGTGSAVFGLFGSMETAEYAHAALSGEYADCFLAQPQTHLQ